MTLEEAEANFVYNPNTGEFKRLGALSHLKVGSVHHDGRIKLRFKDRHYWLHRIAWLIHYKVIAKGIIDHIDGDTSNNRISNLRLVDESQSQKNRPLQSNSPSGCLGVAWIEKRRKWRAQIHAERKNYFLGHHMTIFDAAAARKSAEIYHGFHINHSRPAINSRAQQGEQPS